MGRVYAEVRENGRKLWTLFDTGSKNTYITPGAAEGFSQRAAIVPLKVGLGGRRRTVDKICALGGTIEGKPGKGGHSATLPLSQQAAGDGQEDSEEGPAEERESVGHEHVHVYVHGFTHKKPGRPFFNYETR